MHVDYSNNRVYLHVKNGGEIYDEVYWNFEDLEKGLNKLNKLFVVSAEQKSIDNIYHYHYNSGTVFLDIDFNEFLKILEMDLYNLI